MGRQMSKFDITDCTLEEIVDELGRRSNGLAISISYNRVVNGEQLESTQSWFRGGWVQAIGLFEFGKHDVLGLENRERESF